jgi:hypothetical protein
MERAFQRTHLWLNQKNNALYVGCPKCSELEGVVGESQKTVVYRSCTWSMEKISCQALHLQQSRLFLFNKPLFVLFEGVASSAWLPRSLQQGFIFGTF